MENNTSDIEAIQINGSDFTDTFLDDPRFFYTTTQKILVAFPLCIIALTVVCGNLLVVIAVLSKRYLRTPQNMYFLSLAFVDFLVGIFVLPMNIMNQLHGWRFPLRKAFCKFYVTTDFVLCASSIYHLLAVAEDRYRIVSQGVQYIHDRSLTDVVAKLMIIYVLSLWIASAPLLGWAGDTWLTNYETDRWCSMLDNRYFALFASFGCFWFPAVIMLFYYVRIYNSIAGRLRLRRPTIVADQQSHSSDVLGTGSTSSRSTKNAVKPEVDRKRSSVSIYVKDFLAKKRKFSLSRERKTAKTLGIVVGAFIACWLPFTLLLNTYMINPDLPFIGQIGFEVITWLGYVNSALNPIIYTVFNHEFRQAFKEILHLK